MNKNKSEQHFSREIEQILNSASIKKKRKIEKLMILASIIEDAMKSKGWKSKDLLEKLGKNSPSIVSKWLSGTHNFTVETLFELEDALDVKLLNLEQHNEKATRTYHLHISMKSQKMSFNPLRSLNYLNDNTNESISGLCVIGSHEKINAEA